MITEDIIKEVVDLISHGIHNRRWLFIPPGPFMGGYVFDRNLCESDVRNLLMRILEKNNGQS